MIELRIDPEFKSIIPPLCEDEFKQLEENILAEGAVLTAIVTWNGIIIDGHHRYQIIQKHPDIKYSVHKKEFQNRDEVIIWICKNQLGRRNLSDIQKEDLLGTRFNAEKRAHGDISRIYDSEGNNSARCQTGTLQKTAKRIASEEGSSERSVYRAGHVSSALKKADLIEPGIRDDILSGRLKATKQSLVEIDCASPEDRPQMVADLRKPKESSSSKKGNAIACTPSGRPTSEERKDIRRIVAELVAEKDPVGEDEILVTMDSAFCTMMETCDQLFSQFPGLRTEPKYRNKVIKIIQKPKQYLLKIESEMQ